MFSSERRLIAKRFVACAMQGLSGVKLIACVTEEYPHATRRELMDAAYWAVTRQDADQAIVSQIYDIAISLRKAHKIDA